MVRSAACGVALASRNYFWYPARACRNQLKTLEQYSEPCTAATRLGIWGDKTVAQPIPNLWCSYRFQRRDGNTKSWKPPNLSLRARAVLICSGMGALVTVKNIEYHVCGRPHCDASHESRRMFPCQKNILAYCQSVLAARIPNNFRHYFSVIFKSQYSQPI